MRVLKILLYSGLASSLPLVALGIRHELTKIKPLKHINTDVFTKEKIAELNCTYI